jgi:sugar O-acyltransferase (sialic acid O-acetyltransferase NeuD family)
MHIIGAGGHAKVIINSLLEANQPITAVWDEDKNVAAIMDIPICGNLEAFKKSEALVALIAIGNNRIRKRIAHQLQLSFGLAIHPKSAIAASAQIGEGTVVMANATINPVVIIGQHVIINTNASIDHDCRIDDFVHISPQAGLGGNVSVGEGTHIGIGASVIQGIKIGKWATIGAGAVIIRDVPDYAVVVGNPGKIIKYNKIEAH